MRDYTHKCDCSPGRTGGQKFGGTTHNSCSRFVKFWRGEGKSLDYTGHGTQGDCVCVVAIMLSFHHGPYDSARNNNNDNNNNNNRSTSTKQRTYIHICVHSMTVIHNTQANVVESLVGLLLCFVCGGCHHQPIPHGDARL